MYRLLFFIVISFLLFTGCSKNFEHPVVSKLRKSKNVKIKKNIVSILFDSEELKEITTFTKKRFSECSLIFTPIRKYNLKNSFSVFLNYKDSSNHIRLDIFLDTGRIHLYEKKRGRVDTFIYTEIRPFYNIHEKNIYVLAMQKGRLSLVINKQLIFSEKIAFPYGKIGVGAYGKKGDQVKFIFN